MGNDYVSKLSEDEFKLVCERIVTDKALRNKFKDDPKGYTAIRPGFRPNSVKAGEAIQLAVKNRKHPYISGYVNFMLNDWMDFTNIYISGLESEIGSYEGALLEASVSKKFADFFWIYMKLSGKQDDSATRYITAFQKLIKSGQESPSEEKEDLKAEPETVLKSEFEFAKSEWTKQEVELNGKIKQLHNYSNELQDKVEKAESEINQKNIELEKLKSLQSLSPFSDNQADAEDYEFMSLCQVTNDYEGRLRLTRISDIRNGCIRETLTQGTSSRTSIYVQNQIPAVGRIGACRWSEEQIDFEKTKTSGKYDYTIRPIEVILTPGMSSPEKLCEILKSGITTDIPTGRIMVSSKHGNVYFGVLCDSEQLDISADKVKLREEISTLPVFEFDDNAIIIVHERIFIRRLDAGIPNKIILTDKPLEIVKNIVLGRFTNTFAKKCNITRNDCKNIRAFLSELSATDLINEVADKCHCTEEAADKYFESFSSNVETYMSNSDIESELMEKFVMSREAIIDKCKTEITEKWKAENAEMIAEHENAQNELFAMRAESNDIRKKLNAVEAEIEQKEKLASDVEKKIAERIDKARNDAAEFIASQAFIHTGTIFAENKRSEEHTLERSYLFTSGETIPINDNCSLEGWEESVEELSWELKVNAGINENYSKQFAALVYSAYVNRIPLILVGPNGQDIADALSSIVCGRMSSVLFCDGEYDNSVANRLRMDDGEIITVENPFNSMWSQRVQRIICESSKYFILVTPYIEDLQIEPIGILNYAIPVFTEPFTDKKPLRKFCGGINAANFENYSPHEMKSSHGLFFEKSGLSALAVHNYQRLLTDFHSICVHYHDYFEAATLLAPCCFVCGKKDSMTEYLNDRIKFPVEINPVVERLVGES